MIHPSSHTAAPHPAWPRAVLFDLDGTLIDSVGDIAAALNDLLSRRKLGPIQVETVRTMVGDGVAKLVERAFQHLSHPLDQETLQAEVAEMRKIYERHLTEHTRLLPGAAEAVAALAKRGIAMAVVTNKPQSAAEAVLRHFGLDRSLDVVIGDDGNRARKPAADMILVALDALSASPEDAVLVGDGAADAGAARSAGIPSVLLEGGYGQTPVQEAGGDVLLTTLSELDTALETLRERRGAAR